MAKLQSFLLILLYFVINLCICTKSDPVSTRSCAQSMTSLLNFTSQFVMVQHQLRGSFSIINNCSFRISEFDMLPGSSHVHWWGAVGDDYENLTSGFIISDDQLNASTYYKNDSFTVSLMNNVTWDKFRVVSVWDSSMASDFGHVMLPNSDEAPLNSSTETGLQPTMFENCKVLSDTYRLRWTLNEKDNVIDIGLEGAIGIQNYMAFGWTEPNREHDHMLHADVAVTGFNEEGIPFADDYYITKYSECIMNEDGTFEGVCPDTMYNASVSNDLVNNTRLVYGHRKDGVSFIRFQRPLKSVDKKYDWDIDVTSKRTCIWALGLIKPPDSIRPYYLPQNHGKTYGHVHINVSESVNDCLGPLDAEDKEDQELVIADKKEPIIVTSGPALHYPNPPNPSKVLYMNKKESPVLRVERGVPVKFSIQAGHDVAFYITSDPLGGNATSRNGSETVYTGGPDAQGVQSSPKELMWAPDRNTPDEVYYQSVFTQKMGWKIQVVDGGLTDMYKNSVLLDDQQVNFFWTLSDKSISIAARSEKKSGYLAIGFGSEMENSFAYVGWVDVNGTGRVNTYWIDGMDAQSLHPTNENLTYVRCKSENGVITLEFTRPLDPNCNRKERQECNNIIEPTSPLKVIWAMGAKWSLDHLTQSNMHFVKSNKPVRVSLIRGSAEAEEDLRPVLAAHGFMMFLAWGILLPCGILAARYTKHLPGDIWFKIHVYSQYSGLAITFLGLLFAVAELRGFYLGSAHVKFGILTILMGCIQPVNAYFRPKKPDNESSSSKRIIWEYVHMYVGRCSIFVAIAALISGMKHLGDRYNDENTRGLTWALIVWVSLGFVTVLYLEYKERRNGETIVRSNWVLGNGEEEDADLLSSNGKHEDKDSGEIMEVQLEPVSGRYTVI
ncbi:cytochrome b561, DM13 and DOMON domain-containing protein At5g54830-like [Rutidosis leptorrhynchoides]|uniref:cytochrome b561, DM13 and DOMON domain-containing protein At5g54830-like n=1 Tax=Rutidosis leptorrhynchoides TaxID=125765 RepID=UPI003A9913BA